MAKFQNIFYLLVAFLIPFINCECLNNDSCVCILDEYTKINITLVTVIDSAKGPEFISDSANNNITYEFYGCTDGVNYPYHNKTEVIASLIGVNTTNGTQVKTIGTHHQIQFHIDNELTQLLYRNATGSVIAAIDLICTTYPTPFIKIIAQDDTVRLALNSPHNCLITEHPGLSTGSVLLILFFISISIYLVCGGLILYFIRGARGFEMIPNNDFWRDLPGLVKDGVIFLFSGCNVNAIDAADTYDRIVIAAIDLICDHFPIPDLKIIEQNGNGTVHLELRSPYNCMVILRPLSAGTIFVFLFIVCISIYFCNGALMLYIMRGAKGVELIPHREFWWSLPGLVKDGAIFLFSGCNAQAIVKSAGTNRDNDDDNILHA